MSLWEKIVVLYPEIEFDTKVIIDKCVLIQNNSDGKGDYIAAWEHPTLAKPTDAELKGVK